MKNLKIILFVLISLTFVSKVNAAEIEISSSDSVNMNDTISVNFTLSEDIKAWEFTVNYDKTMLELVSSNLENNNISVSTSILHDRNYTIVFKALKYGSTSISLDKVAYDENEQLLDISVNSKNIIILKNGWITENDNKYYYNNGSYLTNWQTIDGKKYYFDEEGVMQKGIIEIDGNKYLFGVNSGMLYTNGLATTPDKKTYYTNSEGIIQTGWQTINGKKYYFDEEGVMQNVTDTNINGWIIKNGNTYYYVNGVIQKGITEIDGYKYLFGVNSGILYTNGLASTPDGNMYYTNNEGIIQIGWQIVNRKTYYFNENGVMQKGIIEVDGEKYLFGVNFGILYTNGLATTPDGKTYYTNNEGIIQTSWQTIGEKKYYFDENGVMQKGIIDIDGSKYLFGVNSGMLYINGLATTPDGKTYYTNEEGIIQTGWQTISGKKYYFDANGVMQKGVIEIDGEKYLFGVNSGQLYYGWAKVPNGNIYYTNSEGIIQIGEQYIEGRWYKFSSNGILQNGWQTINGNKYYFNPDGSRVTGVAKIAGTRYLFSSNGVLLYSNVKVYTDVSTHQGQIDWDTLWSSGEIDGAILRIGYGSAYSQIDAWFNYNLAAVKRLGIPYTIYLYSYAENSTEAIWEADNLYRWMTNYGVSITSGLPIYLDIEHYGSSASAIAKYSEVVPTFISRMNNYKIESKVYTYANIARLMSEEIRSYVDWIALYNTDPTYEYSWRGWQYTSTGSASGISTRADLNVFK